MKESEILQKLAEANDTLQANTVQLTTITELAVKVGTETDGLQAAIKALQDTIANEDVSPAIEAAANAIAASSLSQATAVAALQAAVQADDDKVPDAPPPPPPPPTP